MSHPSQEHDPPIKQEADPPTLSDLSGSMENATMHSLHAAQQLCDQLLRAPGLNQLNRTIVKTAQKSLNNLSGSEDIDEQLTHHKDLLFFAMLNQSYLSPAPKREHTIYQNGIISISDKVKYLRSEINTPLFGDSYDRNCVLINTVSSKRFHELSAQYVVHAPSKSLTAVSVNNLQAASSSPACDTDMLYLSIDRDSLEQTLLILEGIYQNPDFDRGIYLSVQGTVSDSDLERIENSIIRHGSKAQCLVEQDYDPFDLQDTRFRKVNFLHNQSDTLRYQLIQDAASMGFRPTLTDLVDYHYTAKRLDDILDTSPDSNTDTASIVQGRIYHNVSDVQDDVEDTQHLYQHYTEMILQRLSNLHLQSDLLQEVATILDKEARSLLDTLDIDSLEHPALLSQQSYYQLRTLEQYLAFLEVETYSLEYLEGDIGQSENALFISTNSGMTAIRTIVSTLANTVDEVYSSEHYWETDFLVENACSHNPHYAEIEASRAPTVHQISYTHTSQTIADTIESLVANNADCPGGQLLFLDQSISPFFYTKSLDLNSITAQLSMHADVLDNPIYLVVDNTLDFDTVTADTLFPEGIPEHVYVIFTPSHAKLHQCGFDSTTGGGIFIHAHDLQDEVVQELYNRSKLSLHEEQSEQTAYGLRLIHALYYGQLPQSKEQYISVMKDKRQRNTDILVSAITEQLSVPLSEYQPGDFSINTPLSFHSPDGIRRSVHASFQYDPVTKLHLYVKLLEAPADSYIAGSLFEEFKSRVFERAAQQGIPLADGTSWGFPQTRMDWYMHTLRIAVGLEDREAAEALGTIIAKTFSECLTSPEDFLAKRHQEPLSNVTITNYRNDLLALDSYIPASNSTDLEEYEKHHTLKEEFSSVIVEDGKAVALLLAYEEEYQGEQVVYLSKASTDPDSRGKGYFKRMLSGLIKQATERGYDKIVLHTSASPKNAWVVEAYEKCGFHVSDLKGEFMDNGWPLVFVDMTLSLVDTPPQAVSYIPVPDALYAEMKDTGSLDSLREHKELMGIV